MKMFQVYGGFCHFAEHPYADMHGTVRFCVLAHTTQDAVGKLERYGIRLRYAEFGSTWGESQSQVEKEVTQNHYGDVFFSRVTDAYLSSAGYLLDKNLTVKKRAMQKQEAAQQAGEVVSTGRRPERKEFP